MLDFWKLGKMGFGIYNRGVVSTYTLTVYNFYSYSVVTRAGAIPSREVIVQSYKVIEVKDCDLFKVIY